MDVKPNISCRGFSLIELMVSVAVLIMMMLLVFQMLDETQKTISRGKGMVGSFKEAREGFESMNRVLSQATVNAYLGYDMPSGKTIPKSFGRQSDLQFISGPQDKLMLTGGLAERFTHAVFFQAPMGFQTITQTTGEVKADPYAGLDGLLNSWGYLVEFNSDIPDRPPFLSEISPPLKPKWRFRLMEFRPGAEYNYIYKIQLQKAGQPFTEKISWFADRKVGVNTQANFDAPSGPQDIRTTRVIAENIIALILSPRLTESDVASGKTRNGLEFGNVTDIAPDYFYDSREYQYTSGQAIPRLRYTRNQVPPILQVTVVAMDDGDFHRFIQRFGSDSSQKAPDDIKPDKDWFRNANRFGKDLQALQDRLNVAGIRHRVFTSNVRLREGNSNLSY